jgi:DNA-binding NtrC family response regulator
MPETILLVDDNESLRRLAQRLLTKLGYTVLVAGDTQSALAHCRDCPNEIALLVSDVFMPDMAGPALAAQLVALRPSMKVLYVSGADEAMRSSGVLPPSANFLQKPYTQDEIRARIRQILDA